MESVSFSSTTQCPQNPNATLSSNIATGVRGGFEDHVLVRRGGKNLFIYTLQPGYMCDEPPGHRTILFSLLREKGPWTRPPEKWERFYPHDALRPSPLRYELYPSGESGKSWCTGIVQSPHFNTLYHWAVDKTPMVETRSTYFHYASYISRQLAEAETRSDGPIALPKTANWRYWGEQWRAEKVLQAEKKQKVAELRKPSDTMATEISTLFDKVSRLVAVTRAETKDVELYRPTVPGWGRGAAEDATSQSEDIDAETDEEGSVASEADSVAMDDWDTPGHFVWYGEDDGLEQGGKEVTETIVGSEEGVEW